jgi:hypothetical protein
MEELEEEEIAGYFVVSQVARGIAFPDVCVVSFFSYSSSTNFVIIWG